MTLYKGFSTSAGNIDTRLSDIELVKQDLRNHLSVQRGEVRGVPRFGSRLKEMIGQPLNSFTKNIVENDVRTAINYDPRVELRKIEISSDIHSITIKARLYYVEHDIEDDFEYFLEERAVD
jgi:phage baseplate assembly protein W